MAFIGSTLVWAGLTCADLVVRSAGRVRPVSAPTKVVNVARGEVFSGGSGARAVEVHFKQGDVVKQDDVLIRLDTERLDNEMAKRRRTIRAGEEELAQNEYVADLLGRQYEAAKAKAAAELAQAQTEVKQAKERQALDVHLLEGELIDADNDERRTRKLYRDGAATLENLIKTVAHTREVRAKLEKARLPVEEGRVSVLRRGLELADKDYAVKLEELQTRQAVKRGEVEAARIELANLELERKQAVIRAPVSGVVTSEDVRVGAVLEPGRVVVEIAEQRGFHFEAAIPTEEAARLRLGMPARIKLDAYDYQKYGTIPGTVCFIAPDSGTAEGQKGAFYLVKVAVDEEEVGCGEWRGPVKLGMFGQVEIVNGQETILGLLLKKVRQTISLR
jgi:multidrug resistance efflux pump